MAYVIVSAIAKVLGRNPQDLWLSTTRWVIRFCLAFVGLVLAWAAVSWTGERLLASEPIPHPRTAPTVEETTTTLDPYCTRTHDPVLNLDGIICATPTR